MSRTNQYEIPIPQPGDRYLHFKGTLYTVICTALHPTEGQLVVYSNNGDIQLPLVAKHTETREELIVFQGGAIPRAASFNQTDDVWARPLESFTEILGNGTTQYYGFQKASE